MACLSSWNCKIERASVSPTWQLLTLSNMPSKNINAVILCTFNLFVPMLGGFFKPERGLTIIEPSAMRPWSQRLLQDKWRTLPTPRLLCRLQLLDPNKSKSERMNQTSMTMCQLCPRQQHTFHSQRNWGSRSFGTTGLQKTSSEKDCTCTDASLFLMILHNTFRMTLKEPLMQKLGRYLVSSPQQGVLLKWSLIHKAMTV